MLSNCFGVFKKLVKASSIHLMPFEVVMLAIASFTSFVSARLHILARLVSRWLAD